MSQTPRLACVLAALCLAWPAFAQNEIAEENMSNRAASDAATDRAYIAAQSGLPPVANTVEAARAAAETAGAVGAAAFEPETFEPVVVAIGILSSDQPPSVKAEMLEFLGRAIDGEDVAAMLASIRARLLVEG